MYTASKILSTPSSVLSKITLITDCVEGQEADSPTFN